jgi:hypothetical protein
LRSGETGVIRRFLKTADIRAHLVEKITGSGLHNLQNERSRDGKEELEKT